jgi:hypothetical protein
MPAATGLAWPIQSQMVYPRLDCLRSDLWSAARFQSSVA